VALPQLLKASKDRFPSNEAFNQFLSENGYWKQLSLDESWMTVDQVELDRLGPNARQALHAFRWARRWNLLIPRLPRNRSNHGATLP
jgi:hypothetical protein